MNRRWLVWECSDSHSSTRRLVNHRSPGRVLELLKAEAVPADILRTRGDHTRFGLRVKVYPYPEDVCAVWVMLAVQYRAS